MRSKVCRHLSEAGVRSSSPTCVKMRHVRSLRDRGLIRGAEDIISVEADVFSPNALGGILSERTIPLLRCKIVCGGANNQLATPHDSERLYRRGILYAPDYVVNAGGVIQVADELIGFNRERAKLKVERIPSLLKTIFAISKREGINTELAATRMVEERIRGVLRLRATMA